MHVPSFISTDSECSKLTLRIMFSVAHWRSDVNVVLIPCFTFIRTFKYRFLIMLNAKFYIYINNLMNKSAFYYFI